MIGVVCVLGQVSHLMMCNERMKMKDDDKIWVCHSRHLTKTKLLVRVLKLKYMHDSEYVCVCLVLKLR